MKNTSESPLAVAAAKSKTQKKTPKSEIKTTAKKVTKLKEMKPRFLTLTQLGQEFALSASKAKIVLAASGLIGVDQRPTPKAIEKQAFETRTTVDQYNGLGEVEFLVWDLDKIKRYFTKPDEIQTLSQASNRWQLSRRLNDIILKAAHDLGFPNGETEKVNRWATTMGMSSETLRTIFEARHGSITGFGIVHASTKEEAEKVFENIEPAINELETLLRPKNHQTALVLRGVINNLKAWLMRNSLSL